MNKFFAKNAIKGRLIFPSILSGRWHIVGERGDKGYIKWGSLLGI
jgi:hypothetical protein